MTAIYSLKASFCSICYLFFIFGHLSALPADSSTKSTMEKPRVSIITSVYKGDEFIEGFLEDMTKQTIFNESELILINANSPGNEEPIIKKYQAQYPNIIYEKLDYDPGVYGVWNLGIKKARADFITNANLDDRRNPENLAFQAQALEENPTVDLVYSDYLITEKPNESFEKNSFNLRVISAEFSPEKMFKCLPGPQPMWRKSMHDKCGLFSEKFVSSGDLEMWNRAVSKGCIFKHIPGLSGLYFKNPEGISTNVNSKKTQEDALIASLYRYLWNPGINDSAHLLIKIISQSQPNQFFNALDAYYKNLSGQVPYHFLITLNKDDLTMNNPSVIEQLKTYPHLSFYFDKWDSDVAAYNRDIEKHSNFDILLIGNDNVTDIKFGYDQVILHAMTILSPKKENVMIFNKKRTFGHFLPAMNKKYYDRFNYVYNPVYQSNYFDDEFTLVSKILNKNALFSEEFFHNAQPINAYNIINIKDLETFRQRQLNNFDLTDDLLQESNPKLWSILICTLESRQASFQKIFNKLNKQIHDLRLQDTIEVLSFSDNKEHSIGYKRNLLLAISTGKYVSFIDDDDDIHEKYIQLVTEKLLRNPDCVSLSGIITTDGQNAHKFIHSIAYDHYFDKDGIYYRPPNHLNPIKRSIAIQFAFPEINLGEDTTWALKIAQTGLLKKEESVDEPYYFYLFNTNKNDVPLTSRKYYSQVGQDQWLNENIFKNKTSGVFVDIGAYDGITLSNTCFFEKELGWTGLCVEPNDTAYKKLIKNRSARCVNGCISDNDGTVNFISITNGPEMLSGIVEKFDPRHWDRLVKETEQAGSEIKMVQVDAFNINGLLQKSGIDHIDYLTIDTEGGELNILKSIDFNSIDIDVIDVENNFGDIPFREFLESKGFVYLKNLEQDEIYQNKKYYKPTL